MLPSYKTILCATDLSANAAQALLHAVALGRTHRSAVHILHVLPEMDHAVVNYVSTVMGQQRLVGLELAHKEEVAAQIRQQIEDFARNELADRPEDFARLRDIEVCHGHPVVEILKAADRHQVDLLILGSHGKGSIKYSFLGSVAEKVLRKSHRPVLVVPCSA